jgi:hypothetical protein
MLTAPDVLAHVPEPSERDEGWDSEPAQVEEVEGRAVFGVCYCRWNAQSAEPVMVPEHLRKMMLVRRRSCRGDGCRDHLTAPAGHRQVRLVGEMAAEL